MMTLLFLAWLECGRSSAEFNQPARYSAAERVALLRRSLSAFEEAPAAITQDALRLLRNQSRYGCATSNQQLKVTCLIQAAQTNCAQQKKSVTGACLIISDVINSNIVEENTFIDRREMKKVLRNSHGGGDQTLQALSERYARLTDDYLTVFDHSCAPSDWLCLANNIDRFCMKKSNEKKQSWQGCAGAIVWSIGRYSANVPDGKKR